jgi:sulfur carrier protein
MTQDVISVVVNGQPRELPGTATVADVVAATSASGNGIAVAVNDEVIPRGGWRTKTLRDRDRVEILTAVQGG